MITATPSSLAACVRQVAEALKGGDEDAARFELRALGDEAHALASTSPLFPAATGIEQRQRIAAER